MKFRRALPIVAGALAAAFAPSPPVVPSAWAREHLFVPDGPRTGAAWDPALTPYVAPIIDCLAPELPHTRVVVRKSAQTGLSIGGLAWIGSLIDRAPARMAYVLPTIDALSEFNREKLTPAIENSPALKAKVEPQVARSGFGSTAHSKRFPKGSLVLINANSASELRSKTLRYAVADEVDEWPDDLDGQGDPFTLLRGRFISFEATGEWKILEISTPTLKGSSRIDADFEAGDQRFWFMPCPHCGEQIRFVFDRLRFEKRPPYQAHYVCPENGCIIEHHDKATMVRSGSFLPTNPDGLYPSFHVDAMMSLLTTWDILAELFQTSRGDPRKEKSFWNTRLGLAYEMRGDAPDHERLMERRIDHPENIVPAHGLLLTAGADVQHSGIWVEVVAFAPDRQSWTVSARWLEGDTTDPEAGAFLALGKVYDEDFPDAFGGFRRLDAMGVDAGDGGRANQVYSFTRKRPKAFALKGMPGWTTPAIGTPTKVDVTYRGRRRTGGATLWPVGTWSLKAEFYTNLRKPGLAAGAEADPPGYCHFGRFLGENYFKQITSEYLKDEKTRDGRTRRVWHESGPNHLLDCRVYAMAMADYLGLRRLTEAQWMALARDRGVPRDLQEPDLLAPQTVRMSASQAGSGTAVLPVPLRKASADQVQPVRAPAAQPTSGGWLGSGKKKGWLS